MSREALVFDRNFVLRLCCLQLWLRAPPQAIVVLKTIVDGVTGGSMNTGTDFEMSICNEWFATLFCAKGILTYCHDHQRHQPLHVMIPLQSCLMNVILGHAGRNAG